MTQNGSIKWPRLIWCLAIPLAVGVLGAIIKSCGMEAFGSLNKPPLTPPAITFPIVWTILYLLMGVSLYLTLGAEPMPDEKKRAYWLFGIQLALNLLWTALFFGFSLHLIAFIELIALLGISIAMTVVMLRLRASAGFLQMPYLIWLIYAGYLNMGITLLN